MDHGRKSISAAMGAYLGELFRLGAGSDVVSPSALAEVMGVTPPAAARMISRMETLRLVIRVRYKGVRLTEQGNREALRVIRSHRLSEAFLVNVMGYGWHEAHDLADALAEIADDEFVTRMESKAGNPTRCPHGEPIPSKDLVLRPVDDAPLSELEPGVSGLISRVRTRDEAKLRYLAEVGLVPRARVRLEARSPFHGPLKLVAAGEQLVVGSELAEDLYVEIEREPGLVEA